MYKQCYNFSKSIILVETIHELIYSGCGTIPHQAGKQGKDEPRLVVIKRSGEGMTGVGVWERLHRVMEPSVGPENAFVADTATRLGGKRLARYPIRKTFQSRQNREGMKSISDWILSDWLMVIQPLMKELMSLRDAPCLFFYWVFSSTFNFLLSPFLTQTNSDLFSLEMAYWLVNKT